jgi:hypothetical protein
MNIKPCPFCGSFKIAYQVKKKGKVRMKCLGCDASGPSIDVAMTTDHEGNCITKMIASTEWNTRIDT